MRSPSAISFSLPTVKLRHLLHLLLLLIYGRQCYGLFSSASTAQRHDGATAHGHDSTTAQRHDEKEQEFVQPLPEIERCDFQVLRVSSAFFAGEAHEFGMRWHPCKCVIACVSPSNRLYLMVVAIHVAVVSRSDSIYLFETSR